MARRRPDRSWSRVESSSKRSFTTDASAATLSVIGNHPKKLCGLTLAVGLRCITECGLIDAELSVERAATFDHGPRTALLAIYFQPTCDSPSWLFCSLLATLLFVQGGSRCSPNLVARRPQKRRWFQPWAVMLGLLSLCLLVSMWWAHAGLHDHAAAELRWPWQLHSESHANTTFSLMMMSTTSEPAALQSRLLLENGSSATSPIADKHPSVLNNASHVHNIRNFETPGVASQPAPSSILSSTTDQTPNVVRANLTSRSSNSHFSNSNRVPPFGSSKSSLFRSLNPHFSSNPLAREREQVLRSSNPHFSSNPLAHAHGSNPLAHSHSNPLAHAHGSNPLAHGAEALRARQNMEARKKIEMSLNTIAKATQASKDHNGTHNGTISRQQGLALAKLNWSAEFEALQAKHSELTGLMQLYQETNRTNATAHMKTMLQGVDREMMAMLEARDRMEEEDEEKVPPEYKPHVPAIVVHVPKTGGLSVLSSLASAGVNTCVWGSGFEYSNCSCKGHQVRNSDERCEHVAEAAVVETPYREAKHLLHNDTKPSLFLTIVRDPKSWFYSALGQWCGNLGKDDPGCQENATLRDIGHWFHRRPDCNDAELHRCVHKYYQV